MGRVLLIYSSLRKMAETDAGTPNETSNPLEATPCLLGTLPVMLDAFPPLLAHHPNVA
jgi:hypothetical protein